MCRFAAYIGPKIPLERIVTLPQHSLLAQSQHANEAKLAVNGDGFGVAWYDGSAAPGLYRDVLPAWADSNLNDICRMVKSQLFLAHVRASTVGQTARMNCHPFRYGKWSFMHNGQIGGFARIRRQLEQALPDDLYSARQGSTDSELFFLTLIAQGAQDDPQEAITKTIAHMQALQGTPLSRNRLTCAFSDGESIYAFRYSSDQKSPSLYFGSDLDAGGAVLASEPLDHIQGRWRGVRESEFLRLDRQGVTTGTLAIA